MWQRRSLMCLSVLLLVCFSLWAFPGRVTRSAEPEHIAIEVVEIPDELQKTPSGTMSTEDSVMQSTSSPVVLEAVEKTTEGKGLSVEESVAVLEELVAIQADVEALKETSHEKDEQIAGLMDDNGHLTERNTVLEKEAGTKAYVMLDALLSFSNGLLPEYGVGFTLGTRLGNSLMLELGADYHIDPAWNFGLDNWTFRAGIGWMF